MSAGSSTPARGGSTGVLAFLHLVDDALRLPATPASRWHRAGVTQRTERIVDRAGGVIVLLLAIGWTWSIATAALHPTQGTEPSATAQMAAALTNTDAPTAAYLTDASLSALTGDLRGASGKLRAKIKQEGAAIAADSAAGASLTVAESEASGSAVA
ncbi:MAG: hypothetical protein ABI969_18560, partial [bacterium]